MNYFDDFKEVIPRDIYNRTKTYMSKDVVIFQPEEFVPGLKVTTNDYNFIIFHTVPPVSKLNGKEVQFSKGSLVVLEPNVELINISKDSYLPGKYTSVTIKKNYLKGFVAEAFGREKLKFRNLASSYSSELLDSVEKFKYEISNYGEACPAMIQSISAQIIVELIRDIDDMGRRNIKHNDGASYIKKAIDYMHSYYNSNISIEDISRFFHLSTYHFQRIFKHHTGETPYQYLLKVRINKSIELLNRDNHSMGEIAKLCGFINQSHFSSVFKQIKGIPPTEYKKVMKRSL